MTLRPAPEFARASVRAFDRPALPAGYPRQGHYQQTLTGENAGRNMYCGCPLIASAKRAGLVCVRTGATPHRPFGDY